MNTKKIKTILYILFASPLLVVASGCNMDVFVKSPGSPVVQAEEPASEESRALKFVDDYAEGLEMSVRESKPMLVFFTLSSCASSKRMMETTFCDEEIKRLSHRFVCVRIDGAQSTELCRSKNITSFPTILFQNSRETELLRLSGNQPPEQLALQMHVMLQSTAARGGNVVRK